MIGEAHKKASFTAHAAYLVTDAPERVSWTSARNLSTTDAAFAAEIMRATAARSSKVERPVYELVLAAHPNDRGQLDRAAFEDIADRVLKRLGLTEHQALIVAHHDTAHPHVHIMVNRVHPETGVAAHLSFDRAAIAGVMNAVEKERNLTAVQGRFVPTPELARPSLAEQRIADATLARADAAQARADRAMRAFEDALQAIYREPENARAAFGAMAVSAGPDVASAILRETPETYGTLRESEAAERRFGIFKTVNDVAARAMARSAGTLAEEAWRARAGVPSPETVAAARTVAARARGPVDRHAASHGPNAAAALAATVQRKVKGTIKQHARNLVLGREMES